MPVNQPGGVGAGSPYSPQKFNLPATVQDQGVPPGVSNDGASASFGGIRNTSQIRHATGDDEFIPTPVTAIGDDSDSWWGGVVNCAVSVALSASLSLTSGLTAAAQAPHVQDELPFQTVADQTGSSASFGGIRHAWQTRYIAGEADWATPPAAFTPIEDYWQGPQPAPLILPRQPVSDDDVLPRLAAPDEDYWQNPATSFVAPANGRLYLPDADELRPVKLDEDYWQNLTLPAQPTFYPYPSGDDSSDLPTPPVAFTPVEDYWQLSSAPTGSSNSSIYLPALDDETPSLPETSSDGSAPSFITRSSSRVQYASGDSDFIFTAAVPAPPEEAYNWTSLPRIGNNSGSGNALLNYLGLPLGEGDGFIFTPTPPSGVAIDERYTYDRYATGLYLTGHTSIGEDL